MDGAEVSVRVTGWEPPPSGGPVSLDETQREYPFNIGSGLALLGFVAAVEYTRKGNLRAKMLFSNLSHVLSSRSGLVGFRFTDEAEMGVQLPCWTCQGFVRG